jgi:hypothetical protein
MRTKTKNNPNSTYKARVLLQTGLAAVFLYAGISSLKTPAEWAGYLPGFLTSSFSALMLVKVFAFYELVLAGWLLSGRHLKPAALISALTLGSILVVNPHQLIVTFRDIGLVFMALSLMLLSD